MPFVRAFTDAEPYQQDEPGEASFAWLLKKDELPGLQIGLVELVGPICKTPAAHTEWEQAYVVLSGSGTVHLGQRRHRVNQPTVAVIPRGTMHWVELDAGECLRYIFINQYR